jgi:hypothetical protein
MILRSALRLTAANMLAGACLLGVACGAGVSTVQGDGGTFGGDGAAGSDAAGDAATDDSGLLDGPYACGGKTCATGEYCVHPCAGGALQTCIGETSPGMCPPNTVRGQCFGDAGPTAQGCIAPPPPPICSPKRECPNGGTAPGTSRDVACACA